MKKPVLTGAVLLLATAVIVEMSGCSTRQAECRPVDRRVSASSEASPVAPPKGPCFWRGKDVSTLACDERQDPDRMIRRFAVKPDPGLAFDIFGQIAAEEYRLGSWQRRIGRFGDVSVAEREYLLRFAASKGHPQALSFFDEKGSLLTGRRYDYALAQCQNPDGQRRLVNGFPDESEACAAADPIRPYAADAELQKLLDRYALTVHRFHRSETNSLPFFEFTPKDCPVDEVPLVVYVPGSGEQGTNLCVQFNQRVCLEKVVSSEFQKKHPCRFLLVCLPDGANVGVAHGYPDARNEWSDLYHDLIFAYARQAEGPKVDLRRVYLTALGSGARIAGGLALDHPGRYAASALAWYYPNVSTVHPQYPGSWRIYNVGSACGSKSFAENVLAAGGDCTFHGVSPEAAHPWWNAVWSGDEVWDWLFDKMSTFSR